MFTVSVWSHCFLSTSVPGWGDTEGSQGSTDKLQEAVVNIVPSSDCVNGDVEAQRLIVCAGGAGGRPCKVSSNI